MMKKTIATICLLLCTFAVLCAASQAVIYPLDSSICEDMDNLYSLCSLVRPSTNRPWPSSEAKLILSRVDKSTLSGYKLNLYNKILSQIEESYARWNFGDFSFNVGFNVALEGYAHSNSLDFTTETDWERGYDERKSLMRLYFEFTCNDYFYTTSDIHYKYRRVDMLDEFCSYSDAGMLSKDGYIASYKMPTAKDVGMYYVSKSHFFSQQAISNFFIDTRHFSFIWPRRAVFSLGGETWNFSVNRDVLSLGNANFGNLLVDDHTFSDYAKLSLFSNYFKYDFVLIFLNTIVNSYEDPSTEGRIYMIHTLQFRICDRVSFTISENVMYKYEVFDLAFFNPAFIYHNLNNRGMFNAIAYADLNVLLFPGLELYGQYTLDQARAPNEGDDQSDASGLVVGLSYAHDIEDGTLKIYCEFARTTPLLYRRDGVDFIRVTRYPGLETARYHNTFFDYIGFPYGGDCQLLELRATYTSIKNWSVSAFGRIAEKGQVNIFYSHNDEQKNSEKPNIGGKTPSGDVIKRFAVAGLETKANLGGFFNWPKVSFEAELDWIGRYNYTKETKEKSNIESDVQLTMSVTLGL